MNGAEPEPVVVSAGFSKTHVTTAAAEASARGTLRMLITGAYPTRGLTRAARLLRLSGRGRIARLLERGERVPDDRVRAMLFLELVYDAARALARVPAFGRIHAALCAATWRLYGRRAARLLRGADAGVYHFRAGFGGASLRRAKQLGMVTLCDHSLAHPLVLGELVANRGRIDPNRRRSATELDPLWRSVLADIDAADAVVVNSDFVRDTFRSAGADTERVHVLYLGVDDNFLRAVPAEPRQPERGPLRLLFAGLFDRRKGVEALIEALEGLDDVDWELRIAGLIDREIAEEREPFLADPRVTYLGVLRRPELVEEMRTAPVFAFPSLAEGSARVVFEALASGCYVITTPNSGTIVEDGVHGSLVEPGDAESIAEAIRRADRDRDRLAEIGSRNAALIRESYTQAGYGDGLARIYGELAAAGGRR